MAIKGPLPSLSLRMGLNCFPASMKYYLANAGGQLTRWSTHLESSLEAGQCRRAGLRIVTIKWNSQKGINLSVRI
jgi:hypothetical protein